MKEIPLSRGHVALVDDGDYEEISQHKWRAREEHPGSFYAVRGGMFDGKRVYIAMHRQILGLIPGDGKIGDHIDPSATLDNRRGNLRIADACQNAWNRRGVLRSASGRKGVRRLRGSKRWCAEIGYRHQSIYLGSFDDIEQATEAYRLAALKYHGEFALENPNR